MMVTIRFSISTTLTPSVNNVQGQIIFDGTTQPIAGHSATMLVSPWQLFAPLLAR